MAKKKAEEKELWSGKLTKTPEEFKQELELKKKEIEKYRVKILKKYNDIILSYGPDVLTTMFEKSYKTFEKKNRCGYKICRNRQCIQ